MTFLERVQAVEAARGDVRAVSTRLSIDDLRREVGRRMPFEQVASVMAENPERARNELRAVCREVLSERAHGLPAHEQQRMIDEFVDVVFGMGPIEELVEDETVTEIMVNGARSIYYERNGKLERSDLSFESDEQVRVLIDRIIGPLAHRRVVAHGGRASAPGAPRECGDSAFGARRAPCDDSLVFSTCDDARRDG
mgnify:CR=1 FL=1